MRNDAGEELCAFHPWCWLWMYARGHQGAVESEIAGKVSTVLSDWWKWLAPPMKLTAVRRVRAGATMHHGGYVITRHDLVLKAD